MPRVVDHALRRAEVGAAVWRIVSQEGVEAATVRRVAAETGMSTSVVSHYFAGKDELIRFAFGLVLARARVRARGAEPGARARALLVAALPLDDERRAEARVWFSFLGLALTRDDLGRDQERAYAEWHTAVAQALAKDGLPAHLDAEAEATALIALVDGLTVQAAFAAQRLPPERQLALLDEHLHALGVG